MPAAVVDRKGVITSVRDDLNDSKRALAVITADLTGRTGTLAEAMVGADVFIGVSGPNILQAEHVESTSPHAANDLWALVDERITDASPWISLVNATWVDAVSVRVHNYVRNPVIGVLFDQMWVV